jgi:hypothetical protein
MENLLKEIYDSMLNIETKRYDDNLSKIEKTQLELTLIKLRDMERVVINKKNDEMLMDLSVITPILNELINEMESSGEKLNELNVKLKRLVNIINFLKF